MIKPDWSFPFEIMCDASDYAVRAVLGQRKDKHFQPIHYVEFDIKIRDKKGAENLAADHLSRLENPNLGKLTKAEIRDLFLEEQLMTISDRGAMAGVDINTLSMEQYLALSQENQALGMVKPKIRGNVNFEIQSQFMREFWEDTFFGNKNEDAHDHVDRVFNIVTLPGVSHDAVLLRVFPFTLTGSAKRWVDRLTPRAVNTWDLLKKSLYLKHEGTLSRNISSNSDTDGLAAVISKLDNLGRDMKKLKENVHAIQVGCQICKGPHIDKEYPLNEEVK
ncbi:hypothetical protein Tco_0659288 [Tanacetum coccineum]